MRPPVGQRWADGRQTRPRSVFEKEARGPAIPAAGGFPGKRKNPDVCQHLSFQVEAPSRLELESEAFAELCLTTWPWRRFGAVDEIRTRDIHLGKVALYH